jgi:preprotein translocase subunit SecD
MYKNLRWKLVTIVVVVAGISMFAWYPLLAERFGWTSPTFIIEKRLRLGLDLQGGVHLVLRVHTDDALRLDAQATSERLREDLGRRNVTVAAIEVLGPTQFRVSGVRQEQDGAFRQAGDEVATNYNRESGVGGSYAYTMKPNVVVTLREEAVDQARQTIERRVNELGVAEPVVAIQGARGDEILVQLPGVTEVARAKEIIRSTALLELKLVEQGPASSREELLKSVNGVVPPDMEVVTGAADREPGAVSAPTYYYLVRRVAAVSGRDLRTARPSLDENNQPAVSFSLNQAGAARFSRVTGDNVGRQLAIILDGRVQSAPRIESRISDEGRITGSFTTQEAADLGLILRSGALPASMSYLEERVVGPSLGRDSIRSGVIASIVGLALVVVFLLIYYRLSGINAILALLFNLAILLGLMAYIGATMTLPGIAGFILTMGMGVDSNVLIFERIKEELAAQRGPRQAIETSFNRVFLTLVDTHVATLISAAFLFQFGTGPIRGFALTLSIGLLSNLFTSVFVSKTLFELVLSRRQVATISI